MERPQRKTRKRVVVPEDSDEDFTPKKKSKKVTKPATKMGQLLCSNSSEEVGHSTASSCKPLERKVENVHIAGENYLRESYSSRPNSSKESDDNMWDESEMLSHVAKVPLGLAQSFVALLTEGCTLPFIARYRKANVNYLMPDR